MELYFAATGVKHELDYFENEMQHIPFILPYKDKDGKEQKQIIYGMLAPMKLYRFIFPKEGLDTIIKTLGLDNEGYHQFDKKAYVLRKLLNAKKIPKPSKNAKPRFVAFKNVGIKGIGIKEDRVQKFNNGCTHEAL